MTIYLSDDMLLVVYFSYEQQQFHIDIGPAASIFTAEAEAILEALRIIALQDTYRFLIVTDSRSVLEALHAYPKSNSHPVVLSIRSLAYELKQSGFIIRFLWVPSHMGLDGNECADRIAGTFMSNRAVDDYPLFYRDIKTLDKSSEYDSWQRKWTFSDRGRFLHNLSPRINSKP